MSAQGPPGARPGVPAAATTDMAPAGLGFLLGVAHRAHRRAWEAEIADLGVTAPQAALLRLVAARPGHGVRQLARAMGTDPMNVQRVAESLVADGLCEARRDPGDARRRPLHPTGLGTRRAGALAARSELAEARLAGALGAERYRALLTGLRALIDHDQRAVEEQRTAVQAGAPAATAGDERQRS